MGQRHQGACYLKLRAAFLRSTVQQENGAPMIVVNYLDFLPTNSPSVRRAGQRLERRLLRRKSGRDMRGRRVHA